MYFISFVSLLIVLLTSEINTFRFYDLENEYNNHFTKNLATDNASIDISSVIEEKWIEQRLDHFNQSEHRMWKMRYFENLEFWKPNSTIYVFIGFHRTIITPWLLTVGNIYNLANETNGAMFETEHRYYGLSKPLETNDLENLKYLSSKQALADLAYFIKSIKSSPKFKNSTKSKVVVIGGGHSGNLAAWMRLVYPDLVDAAVASSAPVLAKTNIYEFLETVSDDYARYGQEGCLDKIREIFSRYERLLKTAEGIKQLKAENNICTSTDLTKHINQQNFFFSMAFNFIWPTYGDIIDIKIKCSEIMNYSRSTTVFGDKRNFLWNESEICYDYDFGNWTNNTILHNDDDAKSYYYQLCTEFGHFMTTDSDKQVFTRNIPVEFFYKICTTVYGHEYNESKIDEGVKNTNDLYGGLTPNVSHVVFVNGDMDPWSKLGVLHDLHDAPAIVIPRSSHYSDLGPDEKKDPVELIKARIRVKNIIKKWLNIDAYNSQ